MNAEELLVKLEQQIAELIGQREALRQELSGLHTTVEQQRQEIIRTHEELSVLKREHRNLKTAYGTLGGEEQKEYARARLNRLVERVDNVIQTLNGE